MPKFSFDYKTERELREEMQAQLHACGMTVDELKQAFFLKTHPSGTFEICYIHDKLPKHIQNQLNDRGAYDKSRVFDVYGDPTAQAAYSAFRHLIAAEMKGKGLIQCIDFQGIFGHGIPQTLDELSKIAFTKPTGIMPLAAAQALHDAGLDIRSYEPTRTITTPDGRHITTGGWQYIQHDASTALRDLRQHLANDTGLGEDFIFALLENTATNVMGSSQLQSSLRQLQGWHQLKTSPSPVSPSYYAETFGIEIPQNNDAFAQLGCADLFEYADKQRSILVQQVRDTTDLTVDRQHELLLERVKAVHHTELA